MGVKNIIFMIIVAMFFFSVGYVVSGTAIPQTAIPLSTASAGEQASPSNWIEQNQIHIYQDKIVIDVDDPQWAVFADTNSMDPVIDEGAHAIQIVPKDKNTLKVGDIVSFTRPGFNGVIIHRIVEIGSDVNGWYAITKGDNNRVSDGKVRFKQIHRVLVGVLY